MRVQHPRSFALLPPLQPLPPDLASSFDPQTKRRKKKKKSNPKYRPTRVNDVSHKILHKKVSDEYGGPNIGGTLHCNRA